MENLPSSSLLIKGAMDRQECLSYQQKKNPLPDCWVIGSGFLKVPGCELLVTPTSPQPTRCLDANDGWHDGVRRGDDVCC